MILMHWLDHIANKTSVAASSRLARRLMVALLAAVPIVVGLFVWQVHTAATRVAVFEKRYPTLMATPSPWPQSAPGVLSATTAPRPTVTPSESTSGNNNSAACASIASAGNKDLQAVNSQITQDLSQAKQYASTGDFSDAGSVANKANQLGHQGSSDQTRYEQQLTAQHCSSEFTLQLTQSNSQ